jgi:hypothetical protein
VGRAEVEGGAVSTVTRGHIKWYRTVPVPDKNRTKKNKNKNKNKIKNL